jgi:hypothetical protein
MTRSMMLSLLKQGNTGSEILQILNTLCEGDEQQIEPTLEQIDF